jgi:hypothetical protein
MNVGRPSAKQRKPYNLDAILDVAELLARGVGRAFDALFAVLDEPPARRGAALVRLKYIVHRTIEITVDQLPEVTLLLRVRGNTPVERRLMERRREFDHLMARIVRDAQRQGDIRADVEPRLATRLLFGMLNSITEWYRPSGDLDAAELSEAIFRIAFDGMERRAVRRAFANQPNGR